MDQTLGHQCRHHGVLAGTGLGLLRQDALERGRAAQASDMDGYAAALVNYRFLASAVWTTADANRTMEAAATGSGRSQ